MIRFIRTLLVAASCFMLTLAPALAASTASTLPELPAATASFDSGTLHIDRYGSGANVLIFIPGLSCGPWTWAEQIARFSKDHTVYALTLPGFDGRPFTAQPDLFAAFDRDFWSFLDAQHINKPVVIGHSLGGTLALMLAENHPERLSAVIALDGLPVFPTVVQATPAARLAAAQKLAAQIKGETASQMLIYERGYMKMATTNPAYVDPAAQLESTSVPAAVADWMSEDLAGDLRPQLPKATVRIVELMPYATPSPYTKDQTVAFYRALLAGAPNATVVPIDDARHFAMLDQPQAVDAAIAHVLASP